MSTPATPSDRAALLAEALQALARRAEAANPRPAPADPKLLTEPTELAEAVAESSVRIAEAIARLGVAGEDSALAQTIWAETLAQIDRIQKLHGLPPLPFQQNAATPAPPESGG